VSKFSSRRALGLLPAVFLGALIAFPLGVIAAHRFTDVPDSNIYHNDIDALADAGVTAGCGDGTTFCPSAFVTREQMAAFMNRLGALAAGKTPVVNATKLDGLDSTDFVQHRTDRFNCLGRDMFHVRDESGNAQWVTDDFGRSFIGEYACPVHLPDGAVVTAFRAGVYDNYAGGGVICALYRAEALGTGAYAQMAYMSTSSEAVPGNIVIADTSIASGTVDNDVYGYEAVCTITFFSGIDLVLRGISVEYVSG